MAAAAILDLQNFKSLTIGTVKRFEMHHHAKLRHNRLNRGLDMAIFQFFKMAAAAILDFWNLKYLTVGTLKRVELHHRAKFCRNRSNRGWDMTIFRFSRWRPPPSWICKISHLWRSGGQEVRNASSCQISSKSLKPRLRYNNFSIFPRWRPSAILDL